MLLLLQSCALEERPAGALREKQEVLREMLAAHQLAEEGFQLFIRAFKQERELEVWARQGEEGAFRLLKTYPVCAASGRLGPKRQEGDRQVPEGVYHIDRFNPRSRFFLSLGLNYPNASDRRRGDPESPGSDIFIHGGCASIGCLAITDDGISEVYLLALMAREAGQSTIPVHIFPARLDSGVLAHLVDSEPDQASLLPFWEELLPLYSFFERHKRLPEVKIDEQGRYSLGE